ncbi:hypothetical protein [Bdellovibrio svalbardensis]|uniref:Uncharacterized protein n=1 Tax=Bdellovibrio svalbardensis TaxID=2972972 RepID=A0ABT6DIW3_9BACT|nr:hypothetical protein [Bdellovibrio svalbardensis]MDG0815806.1 hypothetical protein [Bdellovibrio svalbardensis]
MVDYAALVSPLIQSTKDLYGICKASEMQMSDWASKIGRNTRGIASLNFENNQLKKTIEAIKKENNELKLRMDKIEKALASKQ